MEEEGGDGDDCDKGVDEEEEEKRGDDCDEDIKRLDENDGYDARENSDRVVEGDDCD